MSDDSVTDLTRGVYRRLYAGFTKGQRINKLSLPAEAWFWRVLATVDDFGNGDADPELCRAMTAGRRKVTAGQVGKWLDEMNTVGLISFYEVKGERYLHVLKFPEWQPAGKNGKRFKRFPTPDESGGIQVNPVSSSASENTNKNTNKNENNSNPSRSTAAQVKLVFQFWQEHLNHPKSVLDSKRERVIAARLKDGYSVDDLTAAVRGCALTPYNMGDNDRKQVYDDIELVCRDAKHVEMFIGRLSQNGAGTTRTLTVKEKMELEKAEREKAGIQ